MSAKLSEVRWVFDVSKWRPTGAEWLFALSCVQEEERQRITRFAFKRDAKSSLVGRLMLRKLARDTLTAGNSSIEFSRSERGKPLLSKPTSPKFPYSFNISHQGSFAVLAASPLPVGVDVMRVDSERFTESSRLSDFFHTMRRQFGVIEWQRIRAGTSLQNQLLMFYRNWCLKESYVKALGVGITVDLQKIQFSVQDLQHSTEGTIECLSSTLSVDDVAQNQWCFEEQMIDDQHCVCVAIDGRIRPDRAVPFQFLAVDDLVNHDWVLQQLDPKLAVDFDSKEEEPRYLSQ